MRLVQFVLSITLFVAFGELRDTPCLDPNNKAGFCVSLAECPDLSSRLTIDEHRRFVSESRCTHGVDQIPRVCCEHPTRSNVNRFPQLLPSVGVCGLEANIADRITDGEDADLLQHPWSILVINEKKRGRNALFCGGALINARYIVTAAHCLYEEKENEYNRLSIRLGEHTISSTLDCIRNTSTCSQVKDIMVEEKKLHEHFHPESLHNDIALIRLAQAVRFNSFIRPICLPQAADTQYRDAGGRVFEVTGWGKTANTEGLSDTKKIVRLNGANKTYCERKFATLNPPKLITDKQLCAGGQGGKDTCRGDSGSPMVGYALDSNGMGYFYLAGIASFGLGSCGTEGWPGVYTKVSAYLDWIVRNIRPEETIRTTKASILRQPAVSKPVIDCGIFACPLSK